MLFFLFFMRFCRKLNASGVGAEGDKPRTLEEAAKLAQLRKDAALITTYEGIRTMASELWSKSALSVAYAHSATDPAQLVPAGNVSSSGVPGESPSSTPSANNPSEPQTQPQAGHVMTVVNGDSVAPVATLTPARSDGAVAVITQKSRDDSVARRFLRMAEDDSARDAQQFTMMQQHCTYCISLRLRFCSLSQRS